MNDAFLNCNIWSVDLINQPYIDDNFFLVSDIYYYNSLTSGILNFKLGHLQLPEFEIHNRDLLNELDFDFINKHTIPILYRDNTYWKIDLTLYENFKLQRTDFQ
jgi:hypothetical protein